MITWTKTRSHLAIACATACLASCATREPQLVYDSTPSKLRAPVQPPANFVVTLAEARSAIPATKINHHWSIYADRTHYYLISDATAPKKIRDSHLIPYYGHPISGLTRHDIDRVNQARPIMSIPQLELLLPNKASKTAR